MPTLSQYTLGRRSGDIRIRRAHSCRIRRASSRHPHAHMPAVSAASAEAFSKATLQHRPPQASAFHHSASTAPARPIYRSPLRPPLRRTFDSHSPSRGSSSSVRSSHLELSTPYTADGRRRRTPDSRSDPAVVHHRRPRTRKTSPRKLKDVSDAAGGPPVGGHAAASRGAAAAAK